MTRKSTTRRAAIIALAVGAGSLAFDQAPAAELGFYVAGFYGDAKRSSPQLAPFEVLASDVYQFFGFTPEQTLSSSFGDESDSAFGMAAGYRLLANLAFEVGYIDLGQITYRNDSFGTHQVDPPHQEPWFQRVNATTSGIALSALGVLPVSYRWELYARGGVLIATNELDIYVTDFFSAGGLGVSDTSTDLLAGVGASFSFAEVYAARFEFQRVFDAGDDPSETDVDLVSIGFTVAF